MARPALFLDRDGTIIADAHYPSDPDDVVLLPGAAAAIARANAAQVPVIVVTNQSGIGRGHITLSQYEAVRARLDALLEAEHATIDATYHCPHWNERDGPCDCRKPGIGMHKQAAADHNLSLAASAYIGDRWRDVQPAITTGGFGIFVPGAETPMDDVLTAREQDRPLLKTSDSVGDAIDLALAWIAKVRR
ncbi:MAG: HAD-IIIA family hydrolase [Gemmatimonadaceae bacterium]|nr:HAD-IIIA family hydrolase [Gemmatimonadaceae bacterium]